MQISVCPIVAADGTKDFHPIVYALHALVTHEELSCPLIEVQALMLLEDLLPHRSNSGAQQQKHKPELDQLREGGVFGQQGRVMPNGQVCLRKSVFVHFELDRERTLRLVVNLVGDSARQLAVDMLCHLNLKFDCEPECVIFDDQLMAIGDALGLLAIRQARSKKGSNRRQKAATRATLAVAQ